MSVNPKLRFEVFKRDNFTCRYCSRKTPEVILEIDHVIPIAEGGGDEIENLVTACFECNRGKGRDILTADIQESDVHEKTVLLAEREMQLREYQEIQKGVSEREDQDIEQLRSYWQKQYGRPSCITPKASTLRWGLKHFSRYDLIEFMEYAIEKFNHSSSHQSIAYFVGILKNKIKGRDNTNG